MSACKVRASRLNLPHNRGAKYPITQFAAILIYVSKRRECYFEAAHVAIFPPREPPAGASHLASIIILPLIVRTPPRVQLALFAHRCIRRRENRHRAYVHTKRRCFPIAESLSITFAFWASACGSRDHSPGWVTRVSRGLLFLRNIHWKRKRRINIYLVTSGARAVSV